MGDFTIMIIVVICLIVSEVCLITRIPAYRFNLYSLLIMSFCVLAFALYAHYLFNFKRF